MGSRYLFSIQQTVFPLIVLVKTGKQTPKAGKLQWYTPTRTGTYPGGLKGHFTGGLLGDDPTESCRGDLYCSSLTLEPKKELQQEGIISVINFQCSINNENKLKTNEL